MFIYVWMSGAHSDREFKCAFDNLEAAMRAAEADVLENPYSEENHIIVCKANDPELLMSWCYSSYIEVGYVWEPYVFSL